MFQSSWRLNLKSSLPPWTVSITLFTTMNETNQFIKVDIFFILIHVFFVLVYIVKDKLAIFWSTTSTVGSEREKKRYKKSKLFIQQSSFEQKCLIYQPIILNPLHSVWRCVRVFFIAPPHTHSVPATQQKLYIFDLTSAKMYKNNARSIY